MSDLVFGCPTVPVIRSSEVRFSIDAYKARPIFKWPLTYESCGEIIPIQSRLTWGIPTFGARWDSYSGLRIGSKNNNFTLGFRSTEASSDGRIALVERQRVGVAALTLGGLAQFKYWNDHFFWWWPMGDGGDQGDTAGFQFNYNLGHHQLSAGDWSFEPDPQACDRDSEPVKRAADGRWFGLFRSPVQRDQSRRHRPQHEIDEPEGDESDDWAHGER